jgi:hydroxymethylpyrimidine/phosphomethylpyrimidine kinase
MAVEPRPQIGCKQIPLGLIQQAVHEQVAEPVELLGVHRRHLIDTAVLLAEEGDERSRDAQLAETRQGFRHHVVVAVAAIQETQILHEATRLHVETLSSRCPHPRPSQKHW